MLFHPQVVLTLNALLHAFFRKSFTIWPRLGVVSPQSVPSQVQLTSVLGSQCLAFSKAQKVLRGKLTSVLHHFRLWTITLSQPYLLKFSKWDKFATFLLLLLLCFPLASGVRWTSTDLLQIGLSSLRIQRPRVFWLMLVFVRVRVRLFLLAQQ